MTEVEWLTSTNPHQMLYFIRGKASLSFKGRRKLRLFACASVRGIWPLLTDKRSRRAVEVSERSADGLATTEELRKAKEEAEISLGEGGGVGALQAAATVAFEDARWATEIIVHVSCAGLSPEAGREEIQSRWETELVRMSHVLRDIFGNPFRPVTINPAWLTPKATTLAQTIYDDRAFDKMPELANALQEAGCDNNDILSHCRGPGPHVKGCWVVDLLLGKE